MSQRAGVDADTWLQLEKSGGFHFRHSPDGVNWTELACSPVTRADLSGIPLQVGLFQATYSANSGYAVFDRFSLTITTPPPQPPPSWTQPPLTVDPADRLVNNVSTPKGQDACVLGRWDTAGQMDGWTSAGLADITVANGVLTAMGTEEAAYLELSSMVQGPDLDFGYFDYVQFRLKLPAGVQDDIVIFYGTSAAQPGIYSGSTRNLLIPAASIPQDGQCTPIGWMWGWLSAGEIA